MSALEENRAPAAVHKTSGGNNAFHNFHNDFVRSEFLSLLTFPCVSQANCPLGSRPRPQRASSPCLGRDRQGSFWLVPCAGYPRGRRWFLHRFLRHLRCVSPYNNAGNSLLSRRGQDARVLGYRYQAGHQRRNCHWSIRIWCSCRYCKLNVLKLLVYFDPGNMITSIQMFCTRRIPRQSLLMWESSQE